MDRFANRRREGTSAVVIEALECRQLLARFGVIGDFTAGTPLRDVSNLIKSWNPEYVVTVGDNWYNDSSIDQTVGQYFHDFVSPYTGSFGAGSSSGNRFWPTLGNHDYDNSLSQYTSYFTLPNNERYYTTVQGNVQLFIINSNSQEPNGTSSTSTQGTWLKNALAASTATWKLVFFHHPAFTSGTEGDHANMQWPFQQWGASAVFAGHDHIYERILKNGFPYFVNGLGGAEIVPPNSVEPGSQIRYSSNYGAMLLDAGTSSLNFKFINRSGSVIDDYTINATTPPPTGTPVTFIPTGSSWKYLDNGSNQGTAWRASSFVDSSWASGNAELGYGDGDEATIVSFGPSSSNKFVTTYFRKSFNVNNPADVSSLALRLKRDDGAVVYLNGSEVYRSNMPTGTITYNTFASSAIEDNTFYTATLSPSLLQSGSNVIAVEVHQSDFTSSDISFNFELTGTTTGSTTPTAPAAPTGLAASAVSDSQINLTWTDNANNESGFILERSVDGVNGWTQIATPASDATSFSDTGLPPNTQYFYRVRATNSVSDSGNSNLATATTVATSSLPSPWSSQDVGSVAAAGSATFDGTAYAVKGAGTDIWNNADGFQYVYQPWTGNGQIIVRVASIQNTQPWAKAGVMFRESLNANSKEASVVITPSNGIVFLRRTSTGGSTTGTFVSGPAAPYYLKLIRNGSTFTAYRSTNGTSWTLVGSASISMIQAIYVGLAVSSHATALTTATFSNVTVSSSTSATTSASASMMVAPAQAFSLTTSSLTVVKKRDLIDLLA